MKQTSKKRYILYVLLAVCIILIGSLSYKLLQSQQITPQKSMKSVIGTDVYQTSKPYKSIPKSVSMPSQQSASRRDPKKKATASGTTNAKDSLKANPTEPRVQETKSKIKNDNEENFRKLKKESKSKDLFNHEPSVVSKLKEKQDVEI